MNEVEKNNRRTKRILASIFSGIYVVIIFPLLGVLASVYLDSIARLPKILPFPLNIIVAILVLIFGFYWALWSNLEIFRSGKGSPVPLKGTQTVVLVIKGPYKYTRNPMVFGYILFWIGLGFLFNSIFLLFGFSALITLLLILFVKLWEEKNLEKRFGRSYSEYKKRVSFLIPLPSKRN
jgi:protein-S-isoprenylcysteine O-methyltransferase Ste14